MKKYINLVLGIICFQSASAQYTLKEVSSFGKMQVRHIEYYSDTKDWIFSDGFEVINSANDFKNVKHLFNTHPKFQYSVERMANKTYFSRHFGNTRMPMGLEDRGNKLDSSAIYVLSDSRPKVTNAVPSTFLGSRQLNPESRIVAWGYNDCRVSGQNYVFCNNGTIGVELKVNGKDSVYSISTNDQISSLSISADGAYTAVGTKKKGWYFISSKDPVNYKVLPASDVDKEISALYFDDLKQHIWTVERGFSGVKNIVQYDYSSGIPNIIKTITTEELGVPELNDALFAFDFKRQKLYVKSVITNLVKFDILTNKVEHDFWGELHTRVDVVHQIYFNTEDNFLYFSGGKYDALFTKLNNFLFRIEHDEAVNANIIIPKSKSDKNNLYAIGIETAINKVPSSPYLRDEISLSDNGLAVIPFSQNEYLLYNVRNGNLIKSFQAANIDFNIKTKFRESNKVMLSPNGKYIFEWMIKAGMTSGLADTLQMALTDVVTGIIKQNSLVLPQTNTTNVENFAWDMHGRPVFSQTSTDDYPEKKIAAFYIDSLVQTQRISEFTLPDPGVVYDAWAIGGTKNMLYSAKSDNGEKYIFQFIEPGKAARSIYESDEDTEMVQNNMGFLLTTLKGKKVDCSWFDFDGKLRNKITLDSEEYQLRHLAYNSPQLYLSHEKSEDAARIDLLTGKISPINGTSKPGRGFLVSPDEKLLVSVSEDIQAWRIDQDNIFKLYQLKPEKEFIKYTQFTDRHLVSDGRIWDLESGALIQSEISAVAVLDDTLFMHKSFPHGVLTDLGRDNNWKSIFELVPHKRLFSNDLSKATDFEKWAGNHKRVLVVSRNLNTKAVDAIYDLPFASETFSDIFFYPSSDHKNTLVVKRDLGLFGESKKTDSLLLLDLETGSYPALLTGKISGIKQLAHNGGYFFYLLNQQTGVEKMYKTDKGKFFELDSDPQINEQKHVQFTYMSGNRVLTSSTFYDQIDNALYIAYDDGGILKIANGRVEESVKAMSNAGAIVGVKGKYLLVQDKLGHYYFLNKKTLEPDLTLFTWKGDSYADRKYIWFTKENYYMATPGVEGNIHFQNKSMSISLKQGDLIYNRPDKVMEYLYAPKSEIEYYKNLHEIRLNKYKLPQGYDPGKISPIILNVSAVHSPRNVSLMVNAKSAHPITDLRIIVNGCPFPVALTNMPAAIEITQTLNIPLNSGPNTIYTWVEDENGNRSQYDEIKVEGEFEDSGKWYFVGVGVSEYEDKSQDLKYADKDIRDIARFMGRQYPGTSIDTLLNEQVTTSNILAVSEKLKNTNPDDKIYIAYSGHGILDNDKKFWFATHDTDLNNPKENGFSISSITAMLENIPARYRMITLDACHSGDVIQANTGQQTDTITTVANVPPESGTKGLKLLSQKKGNQSSSQLLKSMQLVFTDQLSNTGINLIAASSGTEFALEGNDWKNGVFTFSLLKGWSGSAKRSSTSDLHYRGLKQFVQQNVTTITAGKQTPNTVMENGEINWWLSQR